MIEIALIPSYEPDETLIRLLKEIKNTDIIPVVVDDGSGDKFRAIFDSARELSTVLSYPQNHGKGYALKTGLKYIRENFKECVIVTMDSDGQHLLSDAQALLNKAKDKRDALYIGSRVLPKDAPLRSRFGNALTRLVYKAVTGFAVYDTQSGLRAFSSDMLNKMINIDGDRYEYEMNVLLELARDKVHMEEINIQTIYLDKTNSVSHFNPLSDSVKIYAEIFKYIGSSLVGFLVDYVLYALLLLLGCGLRTSSYGARAVSSIVNFSINRKVVFKSRGNLFKEAAGYFGLVIIVIVINTGILCGIVNLGLNEFLAKIIVEIIMFIFSYAVQHFLIFRKKG